MKKRTRKILITVLSALCASSAIIGLSACAKQETVVSDKPASVVNGGFETADISGWTVESGDAFSNDSVSSRKEFTFAGFENKPIPVNQTGNWYLDGKGFDRRYSNARTGALRSSNFVLGGDGVISMKLAGGALVTRKGEGAPAKSREKICFVGVYSAKTDKMLAKFTNDYFLEHTEDYVNVTDYISGTCCTDNFYTYTKDMSEYVGEEMYLRIVDNDDSVYYGYISVDDIRIGGESEQEEGAYFIKIHDYATDAEAPSEHDIKNGGFESGSLAGWTIVEGTAFSNDGVNAEEVWWNENITYSRDGNYHYGFYDPTATGVMRSSEFVLGGSGYVSYKLGGCSNNSLTYLRFIVKSEEGDYEVARFSNFKYWNYQFPYVENGMRCLNLVQYYVDLSLYIGQTMYIEVVDRNSSADDLGCITLDSVVTYWEEKPVWYTSVAYEAVVETDIMPDSKYQVKNGGFETGDLTGWVSDGNIGRVVAEDCWLDKAYNKKGIYLFTGFEHDGQKLEGNTGTLTSSEFEVGGSGWITYLLGGGKDFNLCYLSVIDSATGEELARFANVAFSDGTMNLYKADLSAFMGRTVKLRLTDNATGDWGLITADSFVTYYANESSVPKKASLASDLLSLNYLGKDNVYQVDNGDFETGNLYGWTKVGNIGNVSDESVWWTEKLPFNKDGTYFFNGWSGAESETGTLESRSFTLGGSGWISFKLGGGKNRDLCYVEIYDKTEDKVIARYANTEFRDNGIAPNDLKGSNLANMVQYKADLSAYLNHELVIRIVDNAVNDWGVMFADSFITYYENADGVPEGAIAAESLVTQ